MMADTIPPLRVAIGEDNTDLADVLAMLLDLQSDMQCVGHADTSEALQVLADTALPDAFVIDLRLRDGPALPLLRRLRATRPDCLLVAFTGDAHPVLESACLEAGCDALVRKDGRPLAVIETLRRLRR